LNIRTIFDLEKALDSPLLQQRLLTALVGDQSPATETTSGPTLDRKPRQPVKPGSSECQLDPAVALDALVSIVRDDLHVQRLRQIWDVIGDRLGERPVPSANQPLRPVEARAAE